MTVSERVNAERLTVLGWGRAILLQLAHPLVAQGVADHSTFRSGRTARVRRLHATIGAMLDLTFGAPSTVANAAGKINAIHDRVHGDLREAAGRFPAGTPYSAHDPELLRWVDATLRDSLPLAYGLFVRPLSDAELDQYCREGEGIAVRLGIPPGTRPASRAALTRYMDDMVATGAIAVTPVARELAREVVAPPFWRLLWPAGRVNRLTTIGLLPPRLREAYGFDWSSREERALARWAATIRAARRFTPDVVALWQKAERAGIRPAPPIN